MGGPHRSPVDGEHIRQHIGVLTLATLVYAKPQTASDLLPLANRRCGLLQGADLKDVRVVPSFPQRRMNWSFTE